MATAAFQTDPVRTQISIAYSNRAYVADAVLPRTTVGQQEYLYKLWSKEDRFHIPTTEVGRRGKVNEVETGWIDVPGSTKNYGLEHPIPQDDIDNGGEDLRNGSAEWLTDLILLDRERRVSAKVFDINVYPATQRETLSGTDQWSDPNSDPVAAISDALEKPIMRPTIMVLNGPGWVTLRRHPKMVTAVSMADKSSGNASLGAVAELFELDDIVVGRARYNSNAKGLAATSVDLWGNHCALLHRNLAATTRMGITFGLSPQWRTRLSFSRQDPDIGLYGGVRQKVGESIDEIVTAADTGYYFEDII